jgi:glycine dehydrogenase subunit 2
MSGPGQEFHQARWNEPVIFELGSPGERGLIPAQVEPEIAALAGPPESLLPEAARRQEPPALPEISQPRLRKHFLRLSQETMGAAIGVDIGQGTATMKYSPPILDRLARQIRPIHPLAPDETVQGLLELVSRFEQVLCALSGLDRFSFQPGGGTHGIYANACIIRAWHARRGEPERDEILTTLHSHPADAAAPATAGFRIVTVPPAATGYPSADDVRALVGPRTAGLMVANPEDTGLFNPAIDEIVDAVHKAGGLCAYDQANANGMLAVARAADAGFDLCQFNLHKTFGSPHGCGGLACGAIGVRAELAPFLPAPTIERAPDGRFYLDHDRPLSAARVRAFHGAIDTVVRAYAWVMSLGPDGLRKVAETAVLNNNYLSARLRELAGVEVSFDGSGTSLPRLEQIRYSLAQVRERTGMGTEAISRRTADHGVAGFFPGHHPWTVSEPMTLEPTESPSRAELDDYVRILEQVLAEAEAEPGEVERAPQRSAIHRIDDAALDDPSRWALTWRAYLRKR